MALFDHPGADGSMDLGFRPDPPPAQEPASSTVTLTQEQFQDLLGRLQNQQEHDYAAAFTGQPEPTPGAAQLIESLPNPNQDFDGFKRGLAQAASSLDQRQTATSQQVLLDNAWALMQQSYPDVAAHPEIVQLATTREMQDLAARGIDFRNVLAGNMEQAVDAVAARAQASIDRIRGIQSEGGDDDVGRADILQGGGLMPRGTRGETPAPKGGLVAELQEIQRKMGIY